MKTSRLLLASLLLAATAAMAESDCTVKVTRFHQSYPYSGKATVEYTVSGILPANADAQIVISTDDASATFVQSNLVAGANSLVVDFASAFGGALLLTNASFVVTIEEKEPGYVQLWMNGPYWAKCNAGAANPEDSGYYFWWGDAVGYRRENDAWVASDGSMSGFSFSEGNTATFDKDDATLRSEGYIDSTGNLAAAHDAATVHLGSPWRMPTAAEYDALTNHCASTWEIVDGVPGRRFMGKDDYADRSIFLPAAGYADGSSLISSNTIGYYWSSTPDIDPDSSLRFAVDVRGTDMDFEYRYYGRPVRPVRDSAE